MNDVSFNNEARFEEIREGTRISTIFQLLFLIDAATNIDEVVFSLLPFLLSDKIDTSQTLCLQRNL